MCRLNVSTRADGATPAGRSPTEVVPVETRRGIEKRCEFIDDHVERSDVLANPGEDDGTFQRADREHGELRGALGRYASALECCSQRFLPELECLGDDPTELVVVRGDVSRGRHQRTPGRVAGGE